MIKLKLKPLVSALMISTFTMAQSQTTEINSFNPTPEQVMQASNSELLALSVGIFDPKFQSLNSLQSGIEPVASDQYGIIQFHAGKAEFNWLEKNGFKVLQSLTNHAYLVNWHNQDKAKLSNHSEIRWFGPYLSTYKVSPDLWSSNRIASSSYQIEINTFNDYPADKLASLIKKYLSNATIVNSHFHKNDHRIVVEIKAPDLNTSLNRLASIEAVQWLSPYSPAYFYNSEAAPAVQSNSSTVNNHTIFDRGLIGTGQVIGIADSGMDRNENWFVNYNDGSGVVSQMTDAENTFPPLLGTLYPERKVVGYWVMPGAAAYDHIYTNPTSVYHGTHVAGSVAGDRSECIGSCGGESPSVSSPSQSGYDNDDGMAPNAQILFQDIGGPTSLSGTGSYPMWQQAYDAGVRIHSNSYGSDSNGAYGGSDQNLDQALRDHGDLIVAFAAGNSGSGPNTIGSPGNAKNAITVGALAHGNSSSVISFSSRGPTDDNRIKPDIMATGTGIQSAAGDANNTSTIDTTPARSTKDGTSMATPILAGSAALMRQYFTDGFYPTGVANINDFLVPSGQLMKAMLLNGTNTDAGFNSNNSGWGRVSLVNTLYFDGEQKRFKLWDINHETGLKTGESHSFEIAVLAGEEFRATLVWYDLPGTLGSAITLVNNLSLTVDTGSNIYLGNRISGGVSVTGGSADNVNTVEQVRFTAPITGTYTLTVSGDNIPGNGVFGSDRQGYALVVSGDLGSINPAALGDPTNLIATDLGLTGIDLNWDEATNSDYYEIYRANGTCQSMTPGTMRFIGQSTSENYTDNLSTGGYNYAYQVRAFNSDFESAYTNCIDVASTQACLLPPQFSAAESSVVNNVGASCAIDLEWPAASSNCPTVSDVSYNIYRSTTHNFVAGAGNLLTSVNNSTAYSDLSVTAGQPYFYRIEAVNNGNNTNLSPELVSTALGTTSTNIGTISDDVDNSLLMNMSGSWSVSNDRASNGTLSYRSTFEGATTYTSNTCARMVSPPLSIPNSGTPTVDYQAWYQIEAEWDGVVVEISTDGGINWNDLPPVGGYPSDFSQTLNPPINACGYPASQGAFGGASTGFDPFSHNLSAYLGQTVQIRWSFSTDPGYEEEGFYLDQVNYNGVNTFNMCEVTPPDLIFEDGFED